MSTVSLVLNTNGNMNAGNGSDGRSGLASAAWLILLSLKDCKDCSNARLSAHLSERHPNGFSARLPDWHKDSSSYLPDGLPMSERQCFQPPAIGSLSESYGESCAGSLNKSCNESCDKSRGEKYASSRVKSCNKSNDKPRRQTPPFA